MQSRQIEVFKLLWYPAAQTVVAQPQIGQAVHVAQFHRYAASQVIVVEVQQTQAVQITEGRRNYTRQPIFPDVQHFKIGQPPQFARYLAAQVVAKQVQVDQVGQVSQLGRYPTRQVVAVEVQSAQSLQPGKSLRDAPGKAKIVEYDVTHMADRPAPQPYPLPVADGSVRAPVQSEYGERSPERVTQRNGYRSRAWDTRVGTMDLHIPKLREGSYFPSLLEPRRRSERALLAVIQQVYVEGVSTRRVDDLVKALGCEGISKSQVSRICQGLDVVVDGFMGRPLDAGPYPYLWLDALTQKVREAGRIVNVSVVVATAVNGEGKREIIGMDMGTSEDGAFWLAFLRSLSARGLGGVELVVSDAHQGLRGAIAAVFGGASWQRCRTHFMTNLLTRVPRRAQL